ncbi:MAG: sn-glycerol-3-phosphate ABC transporter permease UgpA [Legionellales bacterium]|nr:sn-glycerol-3-phosphate ABC transporter permease UgpA [Legionellales bacterium]
MKYYTYSKNKLIPYLFIAPQILVTILFFIWPSMMAVWQSVQQGDPFGISSEWAYIYNFKDVFLSKSYLHSLWITLLYGLFVSVFATVLGLILALLVCRVRRFANFYKILLIWPYAVAPVIAAVLFRFLLNPAIGILTEFFRLFGYEWNYHLNQWHAFWIVVISAVWQQVSYNFLFFLVGLRSIPKSLLEAASIDGASNFQRFFHITLPLLSPTTFFLIVMNLIYSFFDTFGIIHVITQGGPANSTNILVYKVFNDGFVGLDVGVSAAQSVILMLIVTCCVLLQFRYVEKKVHYS